MVVSLGAQYAAERVPGLSDVAGSSATFYTLDGAQSIATWRAGMIKGRLAVVVAGMPFKCPAAPYEAAMLLDYDARQRRVRDALQIDLFTPEAGPMGVAGPAVSRDVKGLLEERGISYHRQHQLSEVNASEKELTFVGGARAHYDWLIYVPPHIAPTGVQEAGMTNEAGWVPVDKSTLETRYRGVYAIGDVTSIAVATGAPLPKAGVFAQHEAEVVAGNLALLLTGRGAAQAFLGDGG